VTDQTLGILFAAPAWAPSRAFGGPVVAAGELVRRLVAHGHQVDVLTTTILDLHRRPAARSSVSVVDGATVHYLATPLRYRWMGITPTLPIALARLKRPDVVHVFGFRDPITTGTAAWCRWARVPYVFEPLGMFQPRLRKVLLKRALDATLYRGVARGAAAVVVASERERDDVVACGVRPERVHVRGNGFPEPERLGSDPGGVRPQLGIPADAPLVLYVGRIAAGKGIDHLLAAVRELPEAHLVIAGPDDRHGVSTEAERVHRLPVSEEPPRHLYPQADVFVLASEGESFGMVAAEAAAAGTPVIVSDRCGIAGFFEDGEALVVPYERGAVVDAIRRVLSDEALREQLALGGPVAARRTSWDHVTDVQESIYRAVASRTAATNASTDAS
jgi:glycosyltransferase involved in cell wall biosynthesis